jgi:hypothetical protein
MPEVRHAGKHHRRLQAIGGRDRFFVFHRSAGLDHRGRAVARGLEAGAKMHQGWISEKKFSTSGFRHSSSS